ncbi:hypothetical protein RSSE_p1676 (plasmid) [Ralstonia solanacearum]|nr:hypothetical protein RSSE_p1676 [Ralstonia solanacearum]
MRIPFCEWAFRRTLIQWKLTNGNKRNFLFLNSNSFISHAQISSSVQTKSR